MLLQVLEKKRKRKIAFQAGLSIWAKLKLFNLKKKVLKADFRNCLHMHVVKIFHI